VPTILRQPIRDGTERPSKRPPGSRNRELRQGPRENGWLVLNGNIKGSSPIPIFLAVKGIRFLL
jgi:hypothetical protein